MSSICVATGSVTLPPELVRSAEPIRHRTVADPDRNGAITFWVPAESSGAQHAGVFASFLTPDGRSHGAIQLVDVDGRQRRIFGALAPIPHTDGKLLIVVISQPLGVTAGAVPQRTELFVWTPSAPNGLTGSSESFYEELSVDPDPIRLEGASAATVGDRVWVPIGYRVGYDRMLNNAFQLQLASLEVGPNELAAHRPIRRILQPMTRSTYLDVTTQIIPAVGEGAWIWLGSLLTNVGWYHPTGTLLPVDEATFGYLQMLAAGSGMNAMGVRVEEIAFLWYDPLQGLAGSGDNFRVAWRAPFATQARVGPRLPFGRNETLQPGALSLNNQLYIMGTNTGRTIPPAAIDAGVADGSMSDGSAADIVESGTEITDASVGDADTSPGVLTIYRVPWGAASGDAFTRTATIQPRVSQAQVVSGSMVMMPGSTTDVGISWVEFYPPDGAGHGSRYVLFAKRQSLM